MKAQMGGMIDVADMIQAAADHQETQTAHVQMFACTRFVTLVYKRKEGQYLSASSLAPRVTNSKAAAKYGY